MCDLVCPRCDSAFQITYTYGDVECPKCHLQGYLAEDCNLDEPGGPDYWMSVYWHFCATE